MVRGRDVAVALALISVAFVSLAGQCKGQLQSGFYQGKCVTKEVPFKFLGAKAVDVEQFVANLVEDAMKSGRIDAAALLRMQFHDCFVKGCDASILLDKDVLGTKEGEREKDAAENASVRGYEFIDFVKKRLEDTCRGVVSCADIIVMATRDAVALSSSPSLIYGVRTGRRDGLVSLKSNVKLPSPSMTVSQSIKAFDQKKLDAQDMVYLIGAHTVGKTRCGFVKNRLYNFNNTSDPNMNSDLVLKLKNDCPATGSNDFPVDLDQGTPNLVDKTFFDQLVLQKGVLQLDQALLSDALTSNTVNGLSNGSVSFASKFAQAMVKLGEIDLLTASMGQIRTSCRAVI